MQGERIRERRNIEDKIVISFLINFVKSMNPIVEVMIGEFVIGAFDFSYTLDVLYCIFTMHL